MAAATIHFYSTHGPNGYMSNFSRHPIVVDGRTYPTSEHYYQSQKFMNEEQRARVRNARTPSEAAAVGRDPSGHLRPDWERVKEEVMMRALREKFSQHPDLARQLVATGYARLVEHTTKDSYWADGGDGRGQNRLGVLLMELREELRMLVQP